MESTYYDLVFDELNQKWLVVNRETQAVEYRDKVYPAALEILVRYEAAIPALIKALESLPEPEKPEKDTSTEEKERNTVLSLLKKKRKDMKPVSLDAYRILNLDDEISD